MRSRAEDSVPLYVLESRRLHCAVDLGLGSVFPEFVRTCSIAEIGQKGLRCDAICLQVWRRGEECAEFAEARVIAGHCREVEA